MKTDAEFRQLRVSHLLIGLRAQRHWLPEGNRVQGTEKSTPVVITKEDIKRLACWISKAFLFLLLECGGGIEGTHCPWDSPLCLRVSEVRTLLSQSEFSCILELKFANPDSLSPPEFSEMRLGNGNNAAWG